METINATEQEQPVAPPTSLLVLDLRDLKVNDCILIVTENSFYSFMITETGQIYGKLTGGPYNSYHPRVMLIGAVSGQGESLHVDLAHLRTKARARFLVCTDGRPGEMRELLTSVIKRLVCIRHQTDSTQSCTDAVS